MPQTILFLGNMDNRVYNWLSETYSIQCMNTKIRPDIIKRFDRVISYGYKHLLKKEHIDNATWPILNLHISYLPWNRGADPNYWSWVENTPKGVTIHQIDEGIDTGDIYVQSIVEFDDDETLSSSYKKLKMKIEDLFIENYEDILNGDIKPTPQPHGGSIHYKKDFPGIDTWNINVKELTK